MRKGGVNDEAALLYRSGAGNLAGNDLGAELELCPDHRFNQCSGNTEHQYVGVRAFELERYGFYPNLERTRVESPTFQRSPANVSNNTNRMELER